MILFNDHILFVHNPKTAGTSLLSYLKETLLGNVRTAGVQQLGTYHPSLSMALGYACGVTGRMGFDRVLSVIRNPFDREVSMYLYFREVLSTSPGLATDLPDLAMQKRVFKSAELGFKDYIKWLWNTEGTVDVWRSRCFYERAEGWTLEGLQVLRFEHLKDDLAKTLGHTIVDLPDTNRSTRKPTAYYFDTETCDSVRKSYSWMFDSGYYSEQDVPSS